MSLACLLKGRSSSTALNRELKRSIPEHFNQGIRPFYAYVRSKRNPADDPTRCREVRKAERSEALWMEKLKQGDTELFDEFLEKEGLHPRQTRGLPDEETLWKDPPADLRRGIEVRREQRKKLRSEVADTQVAASKVAAGADAAVTKEAARGEEVVSTEGGDTEAADTEAAGFTEAAEAEAAVSTEAADTEAAGSTEAAETEAAGSTGAADHTEAAGAEAAEASRVAGAGACRPRGMKKRGEWKKISEELLALFDRSQFVWSKQFASLEEALASGPGILDLFAGSRGLSRACCNLAKTWTLTFDLQHSPREDLLNSSLQGLLFRLVEGGAFFAMVAGPVCASFSTAITPPCRNLEFPEGTPWCSPLQQYKNEQGNLMLKFVLEMAVRCQRLGTLFMVENPDSSWIWRQTRAELSWKPLLDGHPQIGDLRLDFCRFGTRWRKRTRFRCNFFLAGQKVFCQCKCSHIILRGRCKSKNINYTKLAEPYPRQLCGALASSLLTAAGFFGRCRKLDIGACAKAGMGRIGEARNPGPRRVQALGRRLNVDLAAVDLLEPATIQLRAKIWDRFLAWAEAALGRGTAEEWLGAHPSLFVELLVAYGYELFQQGESLHLYRQLLAHTQREHSMLRLHMSKAWQWFLNGRRSSRRFTGPPCRNRC